MDICGVQRQQLIHTPINCWFAHPKKGTVTCRWVQSLPVFAVMEKPSCNIPLIWMNYSDCTVTSLESWLVRESSPSGLISIYFRWITIICPDSCQWISHIVIRCHKSNGYEKNRSPAIVGGQPRTATRLWPRQGPCWSQRWTSHRSSGWRRVKDGGSPTVTKKRLPNISKPSIIIYCYLFFTY